MQHRGARQRAEHHPRQIGADAKREHQQRGCRIQREADAGTPDQPEQDADGELSAQTVLGGARQQGVAFDIEVGSGSGEATLQSG